MSWEIKSKNNEVKFEVGKVEYNDEWMQERYVTVTIESPAPINFQIGDYLIYRGERFEINYDPGKIKSAPRFEKGDAFRYENVKFNSLADELTRCDFLDVVLNDNQLHFTGLPKFTFYGSVKSLADRIQANLDRSYGKGVWKVVIAPEFSDTTELNVVVDTIKVSGALEILVNQFKTYYTIKGRTLTIGAAGVPADHLFQWGPGKGLYEIEENAEADQQIVTRLRAYGSTRNLPHRYYNSLTDADGARFIPDNMAVQHLMLPRFPYTTQDPYIDSKNINALGVREDTIFFDGSNPDLPEIYPSIEGMTAEQLEATGAPCNAEGALDVLVSAEQMEDNGVGKIKGDAFEGNATTTAEPATFKVTIKDVGFNLWEHRIEGQTPTISFKTGMLGGRDFEIVGCIPIKDAAEKVTGYELEFNRVYDEDIKLWFPYKDYNAKKDDKFVLLNIRMPEVYIKTASQRLLEAAEKWLEKNDYSRSIYAPKIDELFMAHQHDAAMASGGAIKSLHDTLTAGMQLLFEDEDLGIDAAIFIDRLTIIEGEGPIPTYEVVLKEEKTVGRLDKMQNQIDSLVAGQGGGGYNASQIRSLINAYGGQMFLSKLKDDRSVGKVASDKGFEVGNYVAGASGAMVGRDAETGQTFGEMDRLFIRVKAYFETLTIINAETLAGKQYITPGGSVKITSVAEKGLVEVTKERPKVDEEGNTVLDSEGNPVMEEYTEMVDNGIPEGVYRCYFLSEQDGEKTETKMIVGDQAISEMFNAKTGTTNKVSNHRYWRLVTAVEQDAYTDENGNHYGYIELSASNCEAGSDVPEEGDVLCQLGWQGTGNAERQTAMVFSTVDADAPSIKMYSGIDSYSLNDKAIISFGRDPLTNQVYFRLGNSTAKQYLQYTQQGGLNIAGSITTTSTIGDKTIGDYIDNAAQDAADKAKLELQVKITELQNQIDGVVETWSGDADPTKTSYPADGWATEAERQNHIGDVYFNIGAYDPDTNPNAGGAWRWYYNSPTDYGWVRIADSDAVRALQLAQMSVLDTDVLYIQTGSQTDAPALPSVNTAGVITNFNGWTTTAPAWQDEKYIWQCTYVKKGDGSAAFAGPTCISGRNGVTPIITEQYYLSTSSTQLVGDSWHDSKPAWVAGCYYWTRSKIDYGDSVEYTDPICVTGSTGTSVLAEYSVSASGPWHPAYLVGDEWMRTSSDGGSTWTAAIRIVGEAGADGRWRKFQWAKNNSATAAPESGWQDTPMTSLPGEYVWMRSGIVVPPATEPTAWEAATRVTGDKGANGSDIYFLDLSNEMMGVICDAKGNVTGSYEKSQASVWKGSVQVTSGITYSIAQTDGITATVTTGGLVTVSALTKDNATVVVQAVVGGVTLQSTISVYKVKAGENGEPAVVYSIEPEVDNITVGLDGTLSTNTLKVWIYKTTGDDARVPTNEKTLKYQRIGEDVSQLVAAIADASVGASITVTEKTTAIMLTLYDTDGTTVLDRERVPLVTDGKEIADEWAKVDKRLREMLVDLNGLDYLRRALRDGATVFEGGLMLSSLIKLGLWDKTDEEHPILNKVYAGLNGVYTNPKSPFLWGGADMVDRFFNEDGTPRTSDPTDYAKAMIRMDGSAYFSGGNAGFEKDGSGWFGDRSTGNAITFADGAMTFGNGIKIDLGNGKDTTFGGIQTTLETVLNFINKLDNYLVPVRQDGTRTQWGAADFYAVKSVKGFYSEEFVSARGLNGNAGSGVVGASALADLTDVALSNLVSGQALVYNGTKWVNQAISIPSLSGYATEQWVTNKGYITSAALAGFATETWVEGKGYITSTALSPYLKSETAANTYLTKTDAANTYLTQTTFNSFKGGYETWKSAIDAFKTKFESLFEKESDGAGGFRIKALFGLYTEQFLSARGLNGSGGGAVGNRLDAWADYAASKEGWVLSAKLGWDLKTRIDNLPTTSVNPYALTVQRNGTTLGTYDGSSAKTINISDVASAASLSSHTSNTTVHITAAERTLWNNTATSLSAILGSDTDNVINKYEEIVAFLDTYTEADTLANLLGNKADKTISIGAGTGLTGGGTLAASRTLSLATSGVTAGTYTKLTVDAYGRATAGASLVAADIPSLDWSKITTGKPTSLSGYGITDAYTKTDADSRYVNVTGDTMTGLLSIGYTGETGLALYRKEAGSGAFIRFYNDNQTTNYFRVGMYGGGYFGIFSSVLNADAMDVFADGKVGFGTTEPAQKVHIAGNIRTDGLAYVVCNGITLTVGAQNSMGVHIYSDSTRPVYLNQSGVGMTSNGTLGTSSYRAGNVYSVLGNFSGQVTAQSLKIGDCEITWDSANGGLKFSKGIYSEGFVSARGLNSSGGGGGGGLIQKVYGSGSLGGTFSDSTLTDTFNAYTINAINSKVVSVQNSLGSYVTLATAQSIGGFKTVTAANGIGCSGFNVGLQITNALHNSIEVVGGNYTMGLGCHSNGGWYWWRGTSTPTAAANKSYVMHFDGSAWDFYTASLKAGSFVKSGGTSSQSLMADGSVRTVNLLSTVTDLGWSGTSGHLATINTLAYWNGRYVGNASNLQYCDRGRFGTIVTASSGDYVTALGTNGNYLTWTKNGSTSNITVPYAAKTRVLEEATGLARGDNDSSVETPQSLPAAIRVRFKNGTGAASSFAWNTIADLTAYSGASNSGAGYRNQFLFSNSDNYSDGSFWVRNGVNETWNAWCKVLTSANYTSVVTTLRDRTNGTATYLNYGAAGISSPSWLAAWNGYELRAISPANVLACIGAASAASLANYVTLGTAQEISGHKVFIGTSGSAYGDWNVGLTIKRAGHTSMEISSDGFTIGLGAHGINKKWYWWMADKYPTNSADANPQYIMEFNGSLFDFKKEIRATSIKKSGGTSSQALMADGSVRTVNLLSTVTDLGWGGTNGHLATINTLAYWNGRYAGNNSNLQYCDRGRFGTIVTASSGDYVDKTSAQTITGAKFFSAGLFVNQNSGQGVGISLYGASSDSTKSYGIMFALTSNYGTHGAVTGDWATYLTMDGAQNRGWIFRHTTSGNVASVNAYGVFSSNQYFASSNNNAASW